VKKGSQKNEKMGHQSNGEDTEVIPYENTTIFSRHKKSAFLTCEHFLKAFTIIVRQYLPNGISLN
jgi:hypothetical protein